ncbi:DUF1345 domain-containing protein [Massilia sp. R2A-15]|uniref:DUF1345 domain-containing protein n=1 Tax=Massilia sp. R2A-15 TaxID=3064278 RepID=UPI0027336EC8|nr:DUF1345 domain-containing protein [Massilia sp. R2A-15]WLI90060.1 DUF1345 domain-containing protein [Massilia sp. R2A-15]
MASTHKKHKWHSILSSRPHLLGSIGLGAIVAVFLPDELQLITRALIAWNVAVWAFLAMMMRVVITSNHHEVRALADKQDENAGVVLVVLLVASIFSLSAIFLELSKLTDAKGAETAGRYALTVATLFGSWIMVGILFCFHYAHKYYRCDETKLPLKFPDDEKEPDYWDFMYFSFTISVAVQTSDVSVMTRGMRKLVLGHSVLNFFFNLVILGLSINIAAGLIK